MNCLKLSKLILTNIICSALFCQVPNFVKLKAADIENSIEIIDSIVGPYNVSKGLGNKMDVKLDSYLKEENSIWFKLFVNKDTIMTFDIVPIDSTNDFDFVLYKCYSNKSFDSIKSNRKAPERMCFSQNVSKKSSTGLSEYSTDNFIKEGIGNSYCKALEVKKGEIYYLLINYGEIYLKQYNKLPKGFIIYFYNYWPNKKPFVLDKIYFETNKWDLPSESQKELDKLIAIMKSNEFIILKVDGYSDSRGNEIENKQLSQKRADAVADYIISKGINRKRLLSFGYGSHSPTHYNNKDYEYKLNRRVEFSFIMK